ncbi:MAG: class II aldolase/adducin family protein [Alphaproteobacteria bacterium]|nr:MAG: class II aldolase/adducin family protein [Alphaproteobacteria bacterium]
MWRARNGFTLLSLIIALCSSAAAQPGVAPEHRPAQGDSDEQRIVDLVVASRILVQEGVLDSFGHVTVRSLKNPNRYFMPRAMPPALVTANEPRTNGEQFIHGEIYRVRPDVQAIVHSHAPAVIPFSISPDRPLRPVLHMAGFLPGRVSVFDHRDVAKDDPSLRGKLMVNNAKLGAALAKTLGNDSVVLIRGHGNAVVGASVPWAVLRAVYTQLNARVQMEAIALGGQVIYLNEDELKMHPVEVFDVDRPWQNLKSRLPKNF